jgi:hypothetical protein
VGQFAWQQPDLFFVLQGAGMGVRSFIITFLSRVARNQIAPDA